MFVVFFVTVGQLSFECELQQFRVMQFSTIGAFIEQQLFKHFNIIKFLKQQCFRECCVLLLIKQQLLNSFHVM